MVRDTESGLLADECEVPIPDRRAMGLPVTSPPDGDSYWKRILRHRSFGQKPHKKSPKLWFISSSLGDPSGDEADTKATLSWRRRGLHARRDLIPRHEFSIPRKSVVWSRLLPPSMQRF